MQFKFSLEHIVRGKSEKEGQEVRAGLGLLSAFPQPTFKGMLPKKTSSLDKTLGYKLCYVLLSEKS